MTYRLEVGSWEDLFYEAQHIREEVFIKEQKVPAHLEFDAVDAVSLHVVVFDEHDDAVGTGRLMPNMHIGRVAVLPSHRGLGIGVRIVEQLLDAAEKRDDGSVVLHAQTHAQAFYEKFGFVAEGSDFLEVGIPHIVMRRVFTEKA